MKESKLAGSLLAAIIVVALGAPAIASADAKSDLQGVSVKVSYADLNLEKQEGAKACTGACNKHQGRPATSAVCATRDR